MAASTFWFRTQELPGKAVSASSTTALCARASSSTSSPTSRRRRSAVRIMLEQGTGGVLLFNTSKQAINPGPKFGAYGIPKAATLFLSRQYALDYGACGIRSNAVNADRIRSGLLTDAMIASRSGARGVSEKEYMSGNLLGQEVTADDVAQAFLQPGAGRAYHRRCDHRRRRQYRGRAALTNIVAAVRRFTNTDEPLDRLALTPPRTERPAALLLKNCCNRSKSHSNPPLAMIEGMSACLVCELQP
ncbi:SDR family oxidoreductase [Mesorhizobium atlanticum]